MMTITDVATYLSTVTYKPNIEFDVMYVGGRNRQLPSWEAGLEEMVVYLIAYAMDSNATYPPAHTLANLGICPETMLSMSGRVRIGDRDVDLTPRRIKLGVQVPDVALALDVAHFQEWFKRAVILKWEMHEVDEWFRVDGKHVTDPHPELSRARRGIDV